MRELVYYVAVSLDGFIAAPDGTFDAFPVEGDHMAVLFRDYADAMPSHVLHATGVTAPLNRFDTVVMGWNTYTPALEAGIGSPYAHLRQIVASRQRRDVADAIELTDDPVATVRDLRSAEGGAGIWLAGGGTLAGALVEQIDRMVLKVNPIVLGDGRRLFERAPYSARRFQLVRSTPFTSGVLINEYHRAADEPAPTRDR